jgi:hypothetical protein
MTKALAEDLIANEGYPTSLLDIPADVHGIGLNYSVWDIQNNLIVQLVEDKQVARAYKGFR